jgi:hypothetical protein
MKNDKTGTKKCAIFFCPIRRRNGRKSAPPIRRAHEFPDSEPDGADIGAVLPEKSPENSENGRENARKTAGNEIEIEIGPDFDGKMAEIEVAYVFFFY